MTDVSSALAASIDALQFNLRPEYVEHAKLDPTWDGSGYSRHPRNTERAGSIPAEPITCGWFAWSMTHVTQDGFPQGGLVYRVDDVDIETGEAGTTVHVAYEDQPRQIRKLLIGWGDLFQAQPPNRKIVQANLDAVNNARKGRQLDAHTLWLKTLDDVWTSVLVERGWYR
jgi:hypothetical protein